MRKIFLTLLFSIILFSCSNKNEFILNAEQKAEINLIFDVPIKSVEYSTGPFQFKSSNTIKFLQLNNSRELIVVTIDGKPYKITVQPGVSGSPDTFEFKNGRVKKKSMGRQVNL